MTDKLKFTSEDILAALTRAFEGVLGEIPAEEWARLRKEGEILPSQIAVTLLGPMFAKGMPITEKVSGISMDDRNKITRALLTDSAAQLNTAIGLEKTLQFPMLGFGSGASAEPKPSNIFFQTAMTGLFTAAMQLDVALRLQKDEREKAAAEDKKGPGDVLTDLLK